MSEFLDSLQPIVLCFIVCAAKIIEITIQSLKTCMMVKGQRMKAAALGFTECIIWGLVISTIIGTLGDNIVRTVFRAHQEIAYFFIIQQGFEDILFNKRKIPVFQPPKIT